MYKKGYIYNNQNVLFGSRDVVGFSNGKLYVKEIDRELANDIIVKNHYSHKFFNLSYIHLGVFINSELMGCLQYGYAMNPSSGDSIVPGTGNKDYLELNRMWLSDKAPRNSESMAISCSIKYIRGKYPNVGWIQSFADERCGCFGIVYQACSFDYFGGHESVFWELDGEVYHNIIKTNSKGLGGGYELLNNPANKDRIKKHTLRQFRYIKFLNKRSRKKCKLKREAYPKYYEERRNNEVDSKTGKVLS